MTILKLRNPRHLSDLLSMKEFVEVFNDEQLQTLALSCLGELANSDLIALRDVLNSEEMDRLIKLSNATKKAKKI